jgi:branched-subunit amino acid aminotransferase/4-amino-4-deoxychorismate lyase
VVIGDIKKQQIKDFEEAFVSSTTRNVHPVVKIDDQVIGGGVPGPITKRLIAAFDKAIQ